MGRLIFRLKYVTDEEADEVRQLLQDGNIDTYETHAGFFGTSVAGIWLTDSSQYEVARSLLKEYGEQRRDRIQLDYQHLRKTGDAETFWQRCQAQPFRVGLAVIAVLFILSFSVIPFVELF